MARSASSCWQAILYNQPFLVDLNEWTNAKETIIRSPGIVADLRTLLCGRHV
jgi:hypothetical protein